MANVLLIGTDQYPDAAYLHYGAALYAFFFKFQAIFSGTVSELRLYSRYGAYVKVAVYAIGGIDELPVVRLAKQDTATLVGTVQWNTIALEAPCSVMQGTYYCLSVIPSTEGAYTTGTDLTMSPWYTANPQQFDTWVWQDPQPSDGLAQCSGLKGIIGGWGSRTRWYQCIVPSTLDIQKGGLLVGPESSDDIPVFPTGTSGKILKADSAKDNGVSWETPPSSGPDMLKSIYDVDNDGIVDKAEQIGDVPAIDIAGTVDNARHGLIAAFRYFWVPSGHGIFFDRTTSEVRGRISAADAGDNIIYKRWLQCDVNGLKVSL